MNGLAIWLYLFVVMPVLIVVTTYLLCKWAIS